MADPDPANTFEVEQKFAIDSLAAFEQRLLALGATIGPARLQVDRYFAHPSRDFAATDEALRIRCVGDENVITYKGPRLSGETKTRREIELPILPQVSGLDEFTALLEALGFTRVAEVRKQRRNGTIRHAGREVILALDEVQQVGTFCELELCCDELGVAAAQEAIVGLARQLGLSDPLRSSYLGMLLGQQDG